MLPIASRRGDHWGAPWGSRGERTALTNEITDRPAGARPGVTAARSRQRHANPSPHRRPRKPPVPDLLRPFIEASRKRIEQRPASPGVDLERGADGYRWNSPHRDLDAWYVQICDAFGTRSHSTVAVFLDQLADLCPAVRDENGDRMPNEVYLNAALNIVNGVRPRNEIEAALAAQMVAVHFMQMKASADALRLSYVDHRTTGVAGKLARTFAMQCDTLAKLKGKTGRQHITVRSDRHYHDHRHLHAEGPGGGIENGGRPHRPCARAGNGSPVEVEGRPALSGPDAARDALPVPGDERPKAVSHPRRRERVGRS